jgi:hypothetical protein
MDSSALVSDSSEVGPHEGKDLRVKEDTLVRDFKSIHTGNHVVVRGIVIVIRNELAVDIAHSPSLGDRVFQNSNAWYVLLNSGRHYNMKSR